MPLTALTARVDAAELTISTLEIGYADVSQDIGEIFPRLASVELLAANNAWRLDNVDAGLDLIPVLFANRIAAQESYFQGTLDQMSAELIAAQQAAADAGIAVQLAEQRYQDARDYIDQEALASRQAITSEVYAELANLGAGLSGEIQTATQGLQTSIDGIEADLQNNFYTRVDTDLAISAAELRLSSSIDTEVNDIYSNLSQIYYTRAGTDSAVAAALTNLRSEIQETRSALLPSNFQPGFTNWTETRLGDPATVAPVTVRCQFISNDADFGDCVEFTTSAAGQNIMTRGVIPGGNRVYRIRARFKVLSAPAATHRYSFMIQGMNSAYTSTFTSFPGVGTLAVGSSIHEIDLTFASTAGAGVDLAIPAIENSAYIRAGFRADLSGTAVARVASITIEDVTDAVSIIADLETNYYTAVEIDSAIAASESTLSAEINGVGATVTEQAAAIANLENGASAGYLVRAQAGGAVSLLDLVAADDGTSPPTSIARLQADDILLDGSVGTNQLVVTDLSGTLINNGDFARGDLRGWGVAPNGWSVVARDTGNGASAIANMPTAYAIMTDTSPLADQVFYQSDRLSVRAGDRLTVTFDYAGIGAGGVINLSMGTQVEWLNGALQTVAISTVPVTGYASTAWASLAPTAVQVPVTAVYARVRLYILGGSVGRGIMSNIRMERQRPASILITPNSITGAQLVTTEVLIAASAQIGSLVVGTSNVANSAITGAAAAYGSTAGNISAWVTITQFWAATEGGRNYIVWAQIEPVSSPSGNGAPGIGQFRLLINGAVVYNSPIVGSDNFPVIRNAVSTAGSTHVMVQILKTGGDGNFSGSAFIVGMEFKK